MKKWVIGIGIVVVLLAVLGLVFRERIVAQFFGPTRSSIVETDSGTTPEVAADNLVTPWSTQFLPDGESVKLERMLTGEILRL